MGHIRLKGRLPKSRNWQQVIRSVADSTAGVEVVAAKTAGAAHQQLSLAADRPYVWYPYWLLIQLAANASTSKSFSAFLGQHGIALPPTATPLEFLSSITKTIENQRAKFGLPSAIDELALNAFHKAVGNIVLSSADSLFGSAIDDVQRAFRGHARKKAFGTLSRAYIGNLYGEVLRYFLSFELGNHIGPGSRFKSLESAEQFNRDLDAYAHQVSSLVDEFAQGWYSKQLWEQKSISAEAVNKFLHVAFRKLQQQLENEAV